jgi:hypothetical protein
MFGRFFSNTRITFLIWARQFLSLLAIWTYPTSTDYAYVFMYRVRAGTATDSYVELEFDTKTKLITVDVWDYDIYVQFSYDGTNYDSAIEVSADADPLNLPLAALKARVINKSTGQNARYQVVGWYQISKRR